MHQNINGVNSTNLHNISKGMLDENKINETGIEHLKKFTAIRR